MHLATELVQLGVGYDSKTLELSVRLSTSLLPSVTRLWDRVPVLTTAGRVTLPVKSWKKASPGWREAAAPWPLPPAWPPLLPFSVFSGPATTC
ncbi:hypothetical protein TAMC210_05520 [Thermanaeromonas sp. C210]|nr:hypothetical protein TAMC210_05520 [Thermanaeromonas sp. C210]